MSTIVKFWRQESAAIIAVALAVVGAGIVSGTWQKVLLAVLPLLGGAAVRQTVWAPDTAQRAVQTTAAAMASQLAPDTVGPAGTVLPAAQAVVDGVVAGVLATA